MGDTYRTTRTNLSVSVGVTEQASDVIELRESVLLSVAIPSGSAITSIAWYASHEHKGTYNPIDYPPGSPIVSSPLSGLMIFQAPDGISSHPYVKCVGDAAGTISISLKS